jgi:hypothetical protein
VKFTRTGAWRASESRNSNELSPSGHGNLSNEFSLSAQMSTALFAQSRPLMLTRRFALSAHGLLSVLVQDSGSGVFTFSLPHRSHWPNGELQVFGPAQTVMAVLGSLILLLLLACVILVIRSQRRREDQDASFSEGTMTASESESERVSDVSVEMDNEATPAFRDSSLADTPPQPMEVDE